MDLLLFGLCIYLAVSEKKIERESSLVVNRYLSILHVETFFKQHKDVGGILSKTSLLIPVEQILYIFAPYMPSAEATKKFR